MPDVDAWAGNYAAPPPLRVLTVAELLAMPPRDYLVKGVMSRGEMSVWWGPPKCGKSFLVMHLAYAVAQGRGAFGRRVKPARVLYLALEGQSGLRARLEALALEHGPCGDFLMIAQPVDLWAMANTTAALVQIIERERIGLVVVDTLNRAIGGGDENSCGDMGAVIGNLDRIRADTDAHVAVVHHGTKNGGGGPRGHGSLAGAADALIEVASEDGSRVATLAFAKDDAAGAPMAFALRVVDLGTDADGDPRTTCIVDEAAADDRRPGKAAHLTAQQRIALELLERAVIDNKDKPPPSPNIPAEAPAAPLSLWRTYCYAGSVVDEASSQATRRKAFWRVVTALQAAHAIGVWEGWAWLAR